MKLTGKDISDLKKLIHFAKKLLEDGLSQKFPIRGAISYGQFNWGNHLVYGRAVINAYKIEKMQKWIGEQGSKGSRLHFIWNSSDLM